MKKNLILIVIATLALSVTFTACKKEEKDLSVKSVEINAPSTTTLNVYGTANPSTLQLTATVLPADALDLSLIWESSNNNFATVSQTGLVTALNAGTVTITAFSNEDESKYGEITLIITRGPHPTWGTIGFISSKEWTITKDGSTQIWSDAVTVQNAIAEDAVFDGGSTEAGFKVAIQKNPGKGDRFSWTAVSQLGTALCPYPWRTPSRDDFIALDRLLGGEGVGLNPSTVDLVFSYIDTWGSDTSAIYWSNSPGTSDGMAFGLQVTYGETFGMIRTPAPNPDATTPAETGCPPNDMATGGSNMGAGMHEGEWVCMSLGYSFTLVTIPNVHIGRGGESGQLLRCIR